MTGSHLNFSLWSYFMKPCTKGTVCVDECNRAEGVCSKGLRAELRGRKLAGFEWSPSSIPSATEKKTWNH